MPVEELRYLGTDLLEKSEAPCGNEKEEESRKQKADEKTSKFVRFYDRFSNRDY